MHPGSVAWVGEQLNLWNVAITRARSHLVVVGDKKLWRKRGGGVGAALLEAAERDGLAPPGGEDKDVLLKRLYQTLSLAEEATVTLGETVHGYPADVVIRADGATPPNPYFSIGGMEKNGDAARHLRLMLHRRNLLSDGDGGAEAARWPAWRLYDTDKQRGVILRAFRRIDEVPRLTSCLARGYRTALDQEALCFNLDRSH